MSRFWNSVVLSAALITPIAIVPTSLRAQEDHRNARTYRDREHNDEHQWNNNEDQAYRMWNKENHRKNREFSKLKERDQQAYWSWRHEHPDSAMHNDRH
jgi:hypothetical protein